MANSVPLQGVSPRWQSLLAVYTRFILLFFLSSSQTDQRRMGRAQRPVSRRQKTSSQTRCLAQFMCQRYYYKQTKRSLPGFPGDHLANRISVVASQQSHSVGMIITVMLQVKVLQPREAQAAQSPRVNKVPTSRGCALSATTPCRAAPSRGGRGRQETTGEFHFNILSLKWLQII